MGINVNDLVETVDDLRFCECNHSVPDPLEYSEDYRNGFNEACSKVVEILYSLSTAPVEVPKFVAEWYEEHKDDLFYSIGEACIESRASYDEYEKTTGNEFYDWLMNVGGKEDKVESIPLLIRMKDGYTVAKEPLYYVMLPEEITDSYNVYGLKRRDYGSINVGLFDRRDIGKCKKSQLTEAEIKAIDKRYMAFAVPVEGEE